MPPLKACKPSFPQWMAQATCFMEVTEGTNSRRTVTVLTLSLLFTVQTEFLFHARDTIVENCRLELLGKIPFSTLPFMWVY